MSAALTDDGRATRGRARRGGAKPAQAQPPAAGPGMGVTDRPVLPRGVRLHDDRVRGTKVLLGPETALMLDEIGAAIIAEIDGRRDVAEIGAALAGRYGADLDEVLPDIVEFLADMAGRRLVDQA